MEPWWWLLSAGIAALLLVLFSFIFRARSTSSSSGQNRDNDEPARQAGVGGAQRAGRAQGGGRRNIRMRLAALQRARGQLYRVDEDEEASSSGDDDEPDVSIEEDIDKKALKKIGTKKLKRIQEKAERKERREQELAHREEQKRREALREEERKKELESERQQKDLEEEKERLRKAEEERREQEEYMRLKQEFVIEEEGVDAAEEEEEARGIRDFINYVKKVKVVTMEDLAAEFNLKTQDAIARVQTLKDEGELTGVMDDRGKFIYISPTEMQAVANFIKQKGRVSLAELVNSSNTLINLQPDHQQQQQSEQVQSAA